MSAERPSTGTDLTRCEKHSNQCPGIGGINEGIRIRKRSQRSLKLITLKQKSLETECDVKKCPHPQLTRGDRLDIQVNIDEARLLHQPSEFTADTSVSSECGLGSCRSLGESTKTFRLRDQSEPVVIDIHDAKATSRFQQSPHLIECPDRLVKMLKKKPCVDEIETGLWQWRFIDITPHEVDGVQADGNCFRLRLLQQCLIEIHRGDTTGWMTLGDQTRDHPGTTGKIQYIKTVFQTHAPKELKFKLSRSSSLQLQALQLSTPFSQSSEVIGACGGIGLHSHG